MTESVPLQRFAPEERQEAILRAAREVFSETGLGGARTKTIAERAGVAEGTVFKYFKNKEVLFERAVVEVLENLVKQVEQAAIDFAGAGSKDRTEHALKFHEATARSMKEIAPLLSAVISSESSDGEKSYYSRLVEPSITRIADALAISLRPLPETIDPRLLALVIFGSHFFIALDASNRDDADEAIRNSQLFVELLAYGIASRPTGTH